MIELVLSACLIATPTTCKDVRLSFIPEGAVTPYQVTHFAQFEAAKWIEANPKWRIHRLSVRRVREPAAANL